MLLAHLFILLVTISMAFGQGISNTSNAHLTKGEREAWHFVFGLCWGFSFLYAAYSSNLLLIVTGLLIRLGMYNIAYNWGAKLNPKYMGDGVEKIESWQIRIFSKKGAVLQLLACIPLAIIVNVFYSFNWLHFKFFFDHITSKIH